MTLSNFENNISSAILKRGQNYYYDHAVKDCNEASPGQWEATVQGTDKYHVMVSLKKNEIDSWYCNCPYEGNICKHVIAALYTIRKEITTIKTTPETTFTDTADSTGNSNCTKEIASLKNILSNTSKTKLISFIGNYAASYPELQNALLQAFTPKINAEKLSDDYKSKINQCFNPISGNRSYSRHYSDFDDGIYLDEISTKLTAYFDKARFLFDQKSFADVASIALHILRSIGEKYEEYAYYQYYDDDFPLSYDCDTAGELLLNITQHPEATLSLKEKIVKEIREITRIDAFGNYGIYDIDELLQTVNLHAQSKEKALLLINELLTECSNYADINRLVNQKIEILYQLNRNEEAQETIQKHLYLPNIREAQVQLLINSEQYSKALTMLDEGINLVTEKNTWETKNRWLQLKLKIYTLQNNIPDIISTAKELFIAGNDSMQYYYILKKQVPESEWKDFLKKILEKANLLAYFGSSVEADIYVEEKEYDRLMSFLQTLSKRDLSFMVTYAIHLRNTHSPQILAVYSEKIQVYAEKNMGRQHYQYVASILKEMLKFKGGKEVVDTLVKNFRTQYKRRPAMMEILINF